jgi:uncharacterized protein (TIGR02453 family)
VTFRGWPAEAIEFYEGLEADNSKTYWNENKAMYESCVRGPMTELLAELSSEFGASKLFRPYRDVRFSSDKAPYKTTIAATLGDGSYIQLSAEGLGVGCGMWMMAPDQLERYRQAVSSERTGPGFVNLLVTLRSGGIEAGGHNSLKTAPKGYPKDHPRIELLRYKGVTAWRQWPPGPWLGKAGAKDRLVKFLRTSQPLNDWLDSHVGPSTLEHWGRH